MTPVTEMNKFNYRYTDS